MGSSLTKGTVRVQVRKDTASNWTSADPTLAVGEFGFETDTVKLKIGNGSTAWTSLAYIGGGTTTWQITRAAYKTNNNSATNYYFPYYSTSTSWTSYDSSPTSLSYSKDTGYIWRADANGTLTNIKGTVRALDTGLTDPVRFYVYKATLPTNSATITATLIGTSDATAPIASRTVTFSTDISSSNDFDAGQVLYVMYKKDSTSGNQDLYFSVTISGEYD